MAQTNTPEGAKAEMPAAFAQLLAERKAREAQRTTREEKARKKAERQLVEAASAYTVDTIVKGVAGLQLDFGRSIDALIETLNGEADRLNDLRRAIDVEKRRIGALRNLQVAADALDLLLQEHQENLKAFEAAHEARRAALEQEMAEQRAAWAQEKAAFERDAEAQDALRQREREQAEEDYQYEQARKRKQATDAFEEEKRQLERRLQEQEAEKMAHWAEREAAIEARREQLERYQAQAQAFVQEQEAAVAQAREEALAQTRQDLQTETTLRAKERAARQRLFELKIESLEAQIAQQSEQIAQLSAQLQAAHHQTQALASRALAGPGSSNDGAGK